MIQESDVREQMIALLEGQLSVQEFDKWLVANSWNMHRDSSPAAVDLVGAVELLLAERSGGFISDDEFCKQLMVLADHIVAEVSPPNSRRTSKCRIL